LTALRIGTRGSALALAQARAVAAALGGPAASSGTAREGGVPAGPEGAIAAGPEGAIAAAPEVDLVVITTAGDVDRARGDKSRWVGALEAALLAGEIDLAVHSAKDVPGELAEGTEIVAAPRRADARDVLVGARALGEVPEGARVGTSALRRRAQVLAIRPDLVVEDLRGNVDTRLRKRAAGEVDVLVLAAAGLARLGSGEQGTALDGGVFVPAPGQGVIAVQARVGSPAAEIAASMSHGPTLACLTAERAAVRELDASCHTPVGVHADGVTIRGFAGLPDGSAWVLDEVDGSDAEAGRELARRMLATGAEELLREAEARQWEAEARRREAETRRRDRESAGGAG
jgi:hydroxymethylbilane synthase